MVLAALGASALYGQQGASTSKRVGTIDLFGYAGWDRDDPNAKALREKLAARVGTEVRMQAQATFRRQVQGDVVAITGKPATDVAVICCNEHGDLSVFVGMQGEAATPLEQQATPTGSDTLPPEALALYEKEGEAMVTAISQGRAGEDDKQGYALVQDPATRTIEEAMRAFALAHTEVLFRVLRRSGAVQQRRAAAALLGYAQRSPAQVHALEDAMNDDDDIVRNNAARALAVLAGAGPLPGLNAEQIIGLLYSGVWTDRNKASALLAAVTKTPDPKLLRALREQALPSLIEGAQWKSQGHALNFALVLGRVVGMSDEHIHTLLQEGKTGDIVEAARALEAKGSKR